MKRFVMEIFYPNGISKIHTIWDETSNISLEKAIFNCCLTASIFEVMKKILLSCSLYKTNLVEYRLES
jgi:hypothetical protein